jgi:cell division protein FtsB
MTDDKRDFPKYVECVKGKLRLRCKLNTGELSLSLGGLDCTDENVELAVKIRDEILTDDGNGECDLSKEKYKALLKELSSQPLLSERFVSSQVSPQAEQKESQIHATDSQKERVFIPEQASVLEEAFSHINTKLESLAKGFKNVKQERDALVIKVGSLEEELQKLRSKLEALSLETDSLESRLAKLEHQLEPPSKNELSATVPDDLVDLIQQAYLRTEPFSLKHDLGLETTGEQMRVVALLNKLKFNKTYLYGRTFFLPPNRPFTEVDKTNVRSRCRDMSSN